MFMSHEGEPQFKTLPKGIITASNYAGSLWSSILNIPPPKDLTLFGMSRHNLNLILDDPELVKSVSEEYNRLPCPSFGGVYISDYRAILNEPNIPQSELIPTNVHLTGRAILQELNPALFEAPRMSEARLIPEEIEKTRAFAQFVNGWCEFAAARVEAVKQHVISDKINDSHFNFMMKRRKTIVNDQIANGGDTLYALKNSTNHSLLTGHSFVIDAVRIMEQNGIQTGHALLALAQNPPDRLVFFNDGRRFGEILIKEHFKR